MTPKASRILVVDDNQAVHEDYRKVLESQQGDGLLNEMESLLFGDDSPPQPTAPNFNFQIDSAFQGAEGLELVRKSLVLERNQNSERDLENRCQFASRNLHRLHGPHLGRDHFRAGTN